MEAGEREGKEQHIQSQTRYAWWSESKNRTQDWI